jgi:Zn-dependent protease
VDLRNLLLVAPVLLFSVIAHEYAHGYAALRQGDTTAYQLGRLTWNPVKHIDPFMTVLLPLMMWFTSGGRFLFGGAKPVPVNPRNYKHYRRGDIIVSLAGIATNLVLAAVCVPLVIVFGLAARSLPAATPTLSILQHMALYGISINLLLAFFNLLPIPPLDGSHVMKYLLPPAWSLRYQQLGRYGILILLALLWVGGPVFAYWMLPSRILLGLAEGLVLPYRLPESW